MIIQPGPSNTHKKANLWLHIASWNLTDFLVYLESKTEPSAAKAQNYMGGYHTEKFVLERGDTAHTFLMSGTNGVGTPHNIYRKSLAVGGWVCGWSQSENNATLWLHLASGNLPDSQLI